MRTGEGRGGFGQHQIQKTQKIQILRIQKIQSAARPPFSSPRGGTNDATAYWFEKYLEDCKPQPLVQGLGLDHDLGGAVVVVFEVHRPRAHAPTSRPTGSFAAPRLPEELMRTWRQKYLSAKPVTQPNPSPQAKDRGGALSVTPCPLPAPSLPPPTLHTPAKKNERTPRQ